MTEACRFGSEHGFKREGVLLGIGSNPCLLSLLKFSK
jgi:hypothetical protein